MRKFDFRTQVTQELLKIRFYYNLHQISRLRKAKRQEVPRNHVQTHMQ